MTEELDAGIFSLLITDQGALHSLVINGKAYPLTAELRLEGCELGGAPTVEHISSASAGGGIVIGKTHLRNADGSRCTSRERFVSTPGSVRYEIEILGASDDAWSAPIRTMFRCALGPSQTFWTSWGDPQSGKLTQIDDDELAEIANAMLSPNGLERFGWSDPFVTVPFTERRFWYGAPYFDKQNPRIAYCPFLSDVISLPIATVIEEDAGIGVTIAVSLDDTMLDLTLDTTRTGDIAFTRYFHRITERRPLRLAFDIVVHEADWRGGVRWLAQRHQQYFNPPNPRAGNISGTGAYSTHNADFDADRLRRMAFGVNWRASFDFPYMGMFIPPVSADERWERFGSGQTSKVELQNYSRVMEDNGFHVLNYFNVTEFGTNIVYPPPVEPSVDRGLGWKDCNDYLYTNLGDAILHVVEGMPPTKTLYGLLESDKPYWTWERAVVMDPGEPVYQEFLLEQARRHIDDLPASSGICIDRMDWLRMFNDRRDDGLSWFDGKPVRSLTTSWASLMEKLGELMHSAGKVIFVNNHVKRIDQLRHVDGIFDEFTYAGAPLNLTALLGLAKPVIGWVGTEENLLPDPDTFMQRFLYMGVFPMAPFPGNDHSLRPSEPVDNLYLDYGPLFSAIKARTWVLDRLTIRADRASVKANLFHVPAGYAVPVAFGEDAESVGIEIDYDALPTVTHIACLHPGEPNWVRLDASPAAAGNGFRVEVPLRRGCALLVIAT